MTEFALLSNIPTPYTHSFALALQRQGVGIRTAYRHSPSAEGRAWAAEESGDTTGRSDLHALRIARDASRAAELTILTGGYADPFYVGRRLLTFGRRTVYWGERLSPGGCFKGAFRRGMIGSCQELLAVGSWAVPSYRLFVGERPIGVMPYTTDGTASAKAREPAARPTIGMACQLIRRKGVDIVLEAVGAMPASKRPVVEVAGSGAAGKVLRTMAADLNVPVVWHDFVAPTELGDIRRRWWLELVPSRWDGWGVVVNEALSSGVPVLASDQVGAAHDLLRGNLGGRMIPLHADWSEEISRSLTSRFLSSWGEWAPRIGSAFSSTNSAKWLVRVATEDLWSHSPSFVEDTWATLEKSLVRTTVQP